MYRRYLFFVHDVVGMVGFEPTRLAAHAPKACASAISPHPLLVRSIAHALGIGKMRNEQFACTTETQRHGSIRYVLVFTLMTNYDQLAIAPEPGLSPYSSAIFIDLQEILSCDSSGKMAFDDIFFDLRANLAHTRILVETSLEMIFDHRIDPLERL